MFVGSHAQFPPPSWLCIAASVGSSRRVLLCQRLAKLEGQLQVVQAAAKTGTLLAVQG